MKYATAFLCMALLLVAGLYSKATMELEGATAALAIANGVNVSNQKALLQLERSLENTNTVLAGWSEDRTTLAEVRSATRQAIREAMRDETFKAWASGAVPPAALRMLWEGPDPNGNGSPVPSGGIAGGLSGNSLSENRN